jgi:hypothetical protein
MHPGFGAPPPSREEIRASGLFRVDDDVVNVGKGFQRSHRVRVSSGNVILLCHHNSEVGF